MSFVHLFTSNLSTSVGQPTKASEYNKITANADANKERFLEGHYFNNTGVVGEDGYHRADFSDPLWFLAKTTGNTTNKYAAVWLDNTSDSSPSLRLLIQDDTASVGSMTSGSRIGDVFIASGTVGANKLFVSDGSASGIQVRDNLTNDGTSVTNTKTGNAGFVVDSSGGSASLTLEADADQAGLVYFTKASSQSWKINNDATTGNLSIRKSDDATMFRFNQSGDTEINGSLIPISDSTSNLGSTGPIRFANLYVDSIGDTGQALSITAGSNNVNITAGTLALTGAQTISSTLGVTGATTIGGGQGANAKALLTLTSTTTPNYGGEIQFHKNSASTAEIGHESAVLGSGTSSDLYLASDGAIDFATGGTTQAMTLTSSGSLTLQTNQNADTALEIYNTNSGASAKASLKVGYDSGNHLHIYRQGNLPDIFYNATQSTASHQFQVAGSVKATLDSTGIGVVTTSPSYPLDVDAAGGTNYVAHFRNTTNTSPYTVWIEEPSSASVGYPLLQVGSSSTERFRVDTGAVTTRLDSTGLGVGTTSPSALIHAEAADGAAGGAIKYTATGVASGYLSASPDGTVLATDTADITFRTGVTGNDPTDTGAEAVRIKSTGMGVLCSPSAPFAVASKASSYEGMELVTPSGDNVGVFQFGVHDSGGSSGRAIEFRRGGSDGFDSLTLKLNQSGSMGLGVAPTATLMHSNNSVFFEIPNNVFRWSRSTGSFQSSNFYYNTSDNGAFAANGYGLLHSQNTSIGAYYWNITAASNSSGAGATTGASLSTKMYLDSTGFGLSTTSPKALLHTVTGTANLTTTGGAGGSNPIAGSTQAIFEHTASNSSIARVAIVSGAATGFSVLDFGDTAQTNKGNITYSHSANSMAFATTDGVAKMTLDANGSVGIGSSPSSVWGSSFKFLQLGPQASINVVSSASETNHMSFSLNAEYDDVTNDRWEYITTGGYAANYYMYAGSHNWRVNNVAGTAGNEVTWNNAMTLTNAGLLGVGTQSPTCLLSLMADGATPYSGVSDVLLDLKRGVTNSGSAANATSIRLGNNSNGFKISYGGTDDHLQFIDGGNEAVMTIANVNNRVGIGTESPRARLESRLDVFAARDNLQTSNFDSTAGSDQMAGVAFGLARNSGTLFDTAGIIRTGRENDWISTDSFINSFMAFYTIREMSVTEKMRLSSEGNLMVGQEFALGRFTVKADTGNNVAVLRSAGAATGTRFVRFDINASTEVGSITYNGTGTAYNTSSDYRIKENITEITDGITRIKSLKPSRFNFISNADQTVDGFVAHEVSDIVPEAITGEKDAVDKYGDPEYQGIDQSKLVPLLTAALQEAITKIETLETKVAALEAA